jgi:Permuted papain-like amidase enzyme, YaeF/YiiX, C92 family
MRFKIVPFFCLAFITMSLFCFNTSIGEPEEKRPFFKSAADFHTGDLIFRESRGLLSSMFKSMSLHEKKYSHVGIILKSSDSLLVYHFLDGTDHNGLKIDQISDFASSMECVSYAVYRPDYTAEQKKNITSLIENPSNKNKEFDHDFSLESDDKLYCTEWIYKLLVETGFHPSLSTIDGLRYVATDNLYINNFIKKVSYVEYKN